ncbi:hypothetical protein Bhyg_03037, partial [Pseudolycoriella hygida]
FYNTTNDLNRSGKFLFDAIFGLESAIEEAADGDTSSSNVVKTCNCVLNQWLNLSFDK